jgi:hypothetical protein
MTKNKIPKALPTQSLKARPSDAWFCNFLGDEAKSIFEFAKTKTQIASAFTRKFTVVSKQKSQQSIVPSLQKCKTRIK